MTPPRIVEDRLRLEVSAVVDVSTLQSLRFIVPPAPAPVSWNGDGSGSLASPVSPVPDLPGRRPPHENSREFVFWEPTFDQLVAGPGPRRDGKPVLARRRSFLRFSARAGLVPPRPSAGASLGQP